MFIQRAMHNPPRQIGCDCRTHGCKMRKDGMQVNTTGSMAQAVVHVHRQIARQSLRRYHADVCGVRHVFCLLMQYHTVLVEKTRSAILIITYTDDSAGYYACPEAFIPPVCVSVRAGSRH